MTAGPPSFYVEQVVIDFHTHIFPPAIRQAREEILKIDPAFAALYSRPRASMATAEELIQEMDRNLVETSVVLNTTWSSAELCRQTNDYILQSVARYPRRLIGFIAIPLQLGEAASNEVERCLRGGARGIGEIRLDTARFSRRSRNAWEPVMAQAEHRGLILLIHASEPLGHLYPGKGKTTPTVVYQFKSLFPRVSLVCAHWGGGLPFYALMPEVASVLRDVYFDSAASPFLYRPAIFHLVSQIVGVDKVLFGSDYPLMTQGRALRYLNASGVEPEAKARILGLNAQELLAGRNK